MSLDDFALIPPNAKVYQYQIGGHGRTKTGKMLCAPGNIVFKAVQVPPKGVRELEFYRKVFCPDCSDPVLLSLRSFIPMFKGLFYHPDAKVHYMCMDDALGEMKHPSLIDIKVGPITYTPDASPAKKAAELAKYKYREEVGFLLTGIKVFNSKSMKLKCFDISHGKSLNANHVFSKGIRLFFGLDHKRAKRLALIFLTKLASIYTWFLNQSQLAFYSTSILLAYDFDSPRHPCPAIPSQLTSDNNPQIDELSALLTSIDNYQGNDVQVKWIDFTHTDTVNEPDNNFIFGLKQIMKYLVQVVTSTDSLEVANQLQMLLDDCAVNGHSQVEDSVNNGRIE